MYADDMVIFSESVDELQKMLDTLYVYSTDWDLTVNVEKSFEMEVKSNVMNNGTLMDIL